MGANICFGIYASLTLLLSINWYLMTVTAEGGLSPPRNLMFEMDAFSLYWKWDEPENLGICENHPVFYHYKYGKKHKSTTQESKHLHADVGLEYSDNSVIDLNHHIYFQLRAQCLNKTVKSQWTNMSVILAKGDPETSVTNFSCVWYNKEHMTCTWQPGKRSPPASDFILLYWLKGSDAKSEVAKPTQFDELLGSGTPCSQYIYKDGVALGCRFNDMHINNAQNLYTMVVTDREKTIRPLISVVNADEKIKLNPPEIINITRTPNHSIFVKWNLTDVFKIKCLQFEVEIKNSKSENPEKYMVSGDLSKEIPNTFPDADYTIKVRVGPKEIVCQEIYWSDWSEGKTLIAKDSGDTLYIILLLVIPIIVTIATIVLLVYMKRLQVLVFPPIPDPGRILKNSFGDPNDFQQWIKYGKVPVSSKPPKEEICSVILVESPLNTSTAEQDQ